MRTPFVVGSAPAGRAARSLGGRTSLYNSIAGIAWQDLSARLAKTAQRQHDMIGALDARWWGAIVPRVTAFRLMPALERTFFVQAYLAI